MAAPAQVQRRGTHEGAAHPSPLRTPVTSYPRAVRKGTALPQSNEQGEGPLACVDVRSFKRTSILRRGGALLAVLSAIGLTLGGAQPASAAATFAPLSSASHYRMNTTLSEDFESIIRDIEASGALTVAAGPLEVAQSGTRNGRALCDTTNINGTLNYNGFCWDEADQATSAYSGGWTPQGLTASHDAYAGGTLNGHHLYAASWYYGIAPGDPNVYRDKFARVSVVESTGTSWNYDHVLLVKPTRKSGEAPNFEPVTQVHADGMVWYGNKLFVANGGELQVYDWRHLWRMDTTQDGRTGIFDGVAVAKDNKWALPMVDRYLIASPTEHPRACPGERACLSSLSLDRSGPTDHLVSGEHLNSDDLRTAHIIRWPLNETSQMLQTDITGMTVTATGAFSAPLKQIQGVATDGNYYYLSAECPPGYMGGATTCIWETRPGQAPTVLTRVPTYTQNLSYSPSSGRLWGMGEQAGNRPVFSLMPRERDKYEYLFNDFSKLCAGVGGAHEWSKPVIQWGCNNAQDERWQFEETRDNNGNLAYVIRNTYSGLCMGTGNSLANGAGVIQYRCNGAVDEKWWYDPVTHELQNVYSGKCLGLGATATKGSQLIQWTCNGAPDERWSKSRTAPQV